MNAQSRQGSVVSATNDRLAQARVSGRDFHAGSMHPDSPPRTLTRDVNGVFDPAVRQRTFSGDVFMGMGHQDIGIDDIPHTTEAVASAPVTPNHGPTPPYTPENSVARKAGSSRDNIPVGDHIGLRNLVTPPRTPQQPRNVLGGRS